MTLTLYKFGPQWGIGDPSPFCLKLESYLKIAGVEHHAPPFDMSMLKKAPKGKFPFVQFEDGEIMGDSNLIIDHLIAKGAPDLDKVLSVEQKAVSCAFRRLLDENLYWVLVYGRWKDPVGWRIIRDFFFGDIPPILRHVIRNVEQKKVWKQIDAHGMGRHSHDEIYQAGIQDLQALGDYLGDKTYFFGTENPTLMDVSLYAYTANFLKAPIENKLKSFLKSRDNLVKHSAHIQALLGA